jgi:hypothetical protein
VRCEESCPDQPISQSGRSRLVKVNYCQSLDVQCVWPAMRTLWARGWVRCCCTYHLEGAVVRSPEPPFSHGTSHSSTGQASCSKEGGLPSSLWTLGTRLGQELAAWWSEGPYYWTPNLGGAHCGQLISHGSHSSCSLRSVSASFCCVTSYSKALWLKTAKIHHFSWFASWLSGSLGPGCLARVADGLS